MGEPTTWSTFTLPESEPYQCPGCGRWFQPKPGFLGRSWGGCAHTWEQEIPPPPAPTLRRTLAVASRRLAGLLRAFWRDCQREARRP